MFPNFWQGECSGGARRRAWKRSGLRRTLNATVSKVDNLVWLPSARKRESWSRGPTVDDFCAGTHGCPPKIGDPRLTHRGPRVDLRPVYNTTEKEWSDEKFWPSLDNADADAVVREYNKLRNSSKYIGTSFTADGQVNHTLKLDMPLDEPFKTIIAGIRRRIGARPNEDSP